MMGFFKSLSKYGLLPATTIGNLLTAGISKVTGKTYGKTTTEQLAQTKAGKVLGLATLGTAGALGVAYGGVSGTLAAAKSIVPKTALGKVAALVVGGAAVTSPLIRETIVEAPFKLAAYGQELGEKIEELPTGVKETAGKFGVAGLIAAGIVGGVVVAPSVIAKAKGLIPFGKDTLEVSAQPLEMEEMPVTPETVDITPKPRARRVSKPSIQRFTQKVNVEVKQQQNKRYKSIICLH